MRDTRFSLGRYQKVVDETLYREEDDEPSVSPTPSALNPHHIIGEQKLLPVLCCLNQLISGSLNFES